VERLAWLTCLEVVSSGACAPLRAIQFLMGGAVGVFWGFVPIWGIHALGASPGALGTTLLVEAAASIGAGVLGGALSDRAGRRAVALAGWLGEAVVLAALAEVGSRVWVGLALLVVLTLFGAPATAAAQALVADVTGEDEREEAYAAVRVASNLGVAVGPPAAGGVLAVSGWPALFAMQALMVAAAAAVALVWVPGGRPDGRAPRGRGGSGAAFSILADRRYLLFLAAATLASLGFVGYETALPLAAVGSYGLSPSQWGVLAALNPALVVVFQMRLTRATARVPLGLRLAVGAVGMGCPFVLLIAWPGVTGVVLVILIAVAAEMLWVPASQGLASRLAPESCRGAYMGAFGATISLAFAVGPLAVLELRAGPGDGAVWALLAASSVAAAALAARAYSMTTGSSATPMSRMRKPRTSAPPPASDTMTYTASGQNACSASVRDGYAGEATCEW
jgi:predicted MFS family arabinose efflux permease